MGCGGDGLPPERKIATEKEAGIGGTTVEEKCRKGDTGAEVGWKGDHSRGNGVAVVRDGGYKEIWKALERGHPNLMLNSTRNNYMQNSTQQELKKSDEYRIKYYDSMFS
ncbi:hypothetical protein LOK49_LG07G01037 [Camellia lanceoleosa]|uniref:Uncharacterized protein n=1 Tax=Camellia lanceoleosa TaxID=1840588 RepID=A0ACC0H8I2_9ERIC|nr:hypothetical protein LOK49_LG07G01037 [Camellia lanceoleosa]